MVENATIVTPDIKAKNGYIHIIDTVTEVFNIILKLTYS